MKSCNIQYRITKNLSKDYMHCYIAIHLNKDFYVLQTIQSIYSSQVKLVWLKHRLSIIYLVVEYWNWHLICNVGWHVLLWFGTRSTEKTILYPVCVLCITLMYFGFWDKFCVLVYQHQISWSSFNDKEKL